MRAPKYRKQHGRDIGFVEWNGKRHYLPGTFNSIESTTAYRSFLRTHVLADAPQPVEGQPSSLFILRLVRQYLEHAKKHYGDGKRGEYANMRAALIPFAEAHGREQAASFGPLKLKAYRQTLIDKKQSRAYINSTIGRIKRAFKWAAGEELVPASVSHGLAAVPGLAPGRTAAKEPPKRKPVKWEHVEPVLAKLSPTVAAMVQVQWLTGCRSKSLCLATPSQFTKDGDLWYWRPRHKTEFRGKVLVLAIGPKCQAVLKPFMDRKPDEFLFSPKAARKNRRYDVRYKTGSYALAVKRGIERAGVPHWSPHQLRHARGHIVREKYGIEAVQAVLGHDSLEASEIYSESRAALAARVARDLG